MNSSELRNKRRVIQNLIADGDLESLMNLEVPEEFGLKELEIFLQLAIEKKQKEIWLYLLQQKQDKYGFTDVEYQL